MVLNSGANRVLAIPTRARRDERSEYDTTDGHLVLVFSPDGETEFRKPRGSRDKRPCIHQRLSEHKIRHSENGPTEGAWGKARPRDLNRCCR
jgi:hypothetical protein